MACSRGGGEVSAGGVVGGRGGGQVPNADLTVTVSRRSRRFTQVQLQCSSIVGAIHLFFIVGDKRSLNTVAQPVKVTLGDSLATTFKR